MTLEERIALGEDSTLELKAVSIPGKRVAKPDTKDVADEFAAAANASGTTFVFDEQIVANASVSALAHDLFGRFRTRLSSADDQEFLSKIRFIAKDEEGIWFPTVGGILMASAHPEDYLPNAFIQAVAYRGTERNANEQVDARDITGPLDAQIMEACHFVKRNMRIAAVKVPARLDIPQYAMNAIFEAITNAVAHRDYSIAESKIRIHMFCDRIEIFSPGALPNSMTIEELSERQFSRNELICTCLSRCPIKEEISDVARTTIMDRRGEGVPVILGASRALSKKTPEYRLIDGCELKLTIRDARVATDDDQYGRRVTEKVTEKPLALEDRILAAIAEEPNLSQRELSEMLGANRAYLARVVSAMQKKGLIRRIGPDKGGHWEVVGGEYA